MTSIEQVLHNSPAQTKRNHIKWVFRGVDENNFGELMGKGFFGELGQTERNHARPGRLLLLGALCALAR